MKKFLLVKIQRGYGCDNTIGCGTVADVIYAESFQQAKEKVLHLEKLEKFKIRWKTNFDEDEMHDVLLEVPSFEGDYALKSIMLYEISDEMNLEHDITNIREEFAKMKEDNYLLQQENKDKQLYLKLKQRFEK